ncbi:hypothetical protein CNMCM8694_005644 [Aspergillus lentulus]|nr:hypothetical protein CNMCM8060_004225 [Aspergillus lentulus]KAF4195902.1 hypothetical protein CNMCM8694_005644 [Aspergillus lentulus]
MGQLVKSELDLDNFIGAEDSTQGLAWSQKGFTRKADPRRSVHFEFEDANYEQPVLRAKVFGNKEANINLRERIRNINGRLEFV